MYIELWEHGGFGSGSRGEFVSQEETQKNTELRMSTDNIVHCCCGPAKSNWVCGTTEIFTRSKSRLFMVGLVSAAGSEGGSPPGFFLPADLCLSCIFFGVLGLECVTLLSAFFLTWHFSSCAPPMVYKDSSLTGWGTCHILVWGCFCSLHLQKSRVSEEFRRHTTLTWHSWPISPVYFPLQSLSRFSSEARS